MWDEKAISKNYFNSESSTTNGRKYYDFQWHSVKSTFHCYCNIQFFFWAAFDQEEIKVREREVSWNKEENKKRAVSFFFLFFFSACLYGFNVLFLFGYHDFMFTLCLSLFMQRGNSLWILVFKTMYVLEWRCLNLFDFKVFVGKKFHSGAWLSCLTSWRPSLISMPPQGHVHTAQSSVYPCQCSAPCPAVPCTAFRENCLHWMLSRSFPH